MPSIWRTAGEPMAARSRRSRSTVPSGRSLARKNSPLEDPPRISTQRMSSTLRSPQPPLFCREAMLGSWRAALKCNNVQLYCVLRIAGGGAMKIDFDGIQAFVAIAELGGFSKAAEQLHVTQKIGR